jgi:geranylgeranyl diphosphate synthase type II
LDSGSGTTAHDTDSADHLVRSTLEEYGALTLEAVERHLAPREPRRHLYDLVADYPRRGGRKLRPSLCIATARAFGAGRDEAVSTAAALELLHNAFLVHDDVEDESEARRGRPTLHRLHGVPMAVNVGDALLLIGLRALIDNQRQLGPRLTLLVLEEAERMARESIEGQAIELGWRRDNALELAEDDYLEMVFKKTCWYTTIFPSRVGALIGTRNARSLDRFDRFGFFLGAAFQIQDDLLNLVGDEARYGKELDGDIREGKRTLMLIHLLNRASEAERRQIAEYLAAPRADHTESQVRWIRERMDHHGCIADARHTAHSLAGAALHEFDQIYGALPETRDRRFVSGVVRWVLSRT